MKRDPASFDAAAGQLLHVGTDSIKAIPVIVASLDFPEVHAQALDLLSRLGRQMPQVIPILVGSTRSEKAAIRSGLAEVFYNIGSEAKEAFPSLLEMLDDSDHRTRMMAYNTLKKYGPPAAHEAITKFEEKESSRRK